MAKPTNVEHAVHITYIFSLITTYLVQLSLMEINRKAAVTSHYITIS